MIVFQINNKMEALHAFWAIYEKVMSGFSEIEGESVNLIL